jgi:hypothetical protein
LLIPLVSSCNLSGRQAVSNPDEMPKTPLTLPLVTADLTLTGAVDAHITQVRLLDCRTHPAGTADFFRSVVLFQIGQQWYRLSALTSGPPVRPYPTPSSTDHRGPGDYRGFAYLDEQLVGPGGMALGDRAWGTRQTVAITVGANPESVSLGTVKDPPTPASGPVIVIDSVDFEPRDPNTTGPGPTAAPAEEFIHFRGNWSCEPGSPAVSRRWP